MRLPAFVRSVRFRLAVTYSVLVFALAIAVVLVVNVVVSRSLEAETVSRGQVTTIIDPATGATFTIEREVQFQFVTLEQLVNAKTLNDLRRTSLWVLVGMFPFSVAIGWFVADRALRPIGAVTATAREIRSTADLSRRIDLDGPEDELQALADTFDEMLDGIEEGARARRAFVQDISHELRNPLAVMATNLDVVLADDDATTGELRETALVVRRSVERAARTVDNLVLFARDELPEGGRTPVDLRAVADDVLDEHRGPIAERSLRTERIGGSVVVVADREGLKRAVGNLVNNAVRLGRPGSAIRAGTGREGAWAWLAIEDEGPGIDPRDHEQVFRRYWTQGSSSIGGEDRSGLGLAIVRQVAEVHGGAATVLSERGGGAQFVIWLPAEPGAELGAVTADGVHPVRDVLSQPPV